MKDWRKLTKKEIIHIVEGMKSDEQIIDSIKDNRQEQKKIMAIPNRSVQVGREPCWECRIIAQRLGLES